jgi:molybdopterin-guanine dinucleotide biosynthesis protein B
MTVPVISVVGWHNAGKTTLIEGLVAALKQRGVRVAVIKHTQGHFELDRPGSDSWRYVQAGSDVAVLVGTGQLVTIEACAEEPDLAEILARLPAGIDLVITEGFKRAPTPKIEVVRPGYGEGRIAHEGELLALVYNDGEAAQGERIFGLGEIDRLVELLAQRRLI